MNIRFLQALRIPSFLALWLAEVVSQVAINTLNFLLILVVFSLTNSNTAVSGVILMFTIPAILFAIPAGVFVDRKNKKKVIIATNVVRTVFMIALAFSYHTLFFVYAITFLTSVVMQFFIPAETPMIPILVKKDLLLSANSLFGIALFGSIFIAYALSGPYLSFFGTQHALLGLGLLFFIGALLVMTIRLPKLSVKKVMQDRPIGVMDEVKETLHMIIKIPKLYHAFSLLIISQILVFIIAVLGPGYAKHILHIPITQFPVIFVAPAMLGLGCGTFVLTSYLHRVGKHNSGTIGLFITAATLVLLPYGSFLTSKSFSQFLNTFLPHILQITPLHILVVLAFILGFANALIFVPSNTIIQEETAEQMRGKIYGALNALTSALSLLPVIMVGSLADIFGIAAVLTVLGIAVGFIAAARLFVRII